MLKKIRQDIGPAPSASVIANRNDLDSLQRVPDKEDKITEMPHFETFLSGFRAQADVLWMPTARHGYNKILVIIDDHTKKCDAEPMVGEDSTTIVQCMKRIFKRGILKQPRMLEFDNGSSFHGDVITFCNQNHIVYRYAMTNRHRQQGLVESKNGTLGRILNAFLNEKELENLKAAEKPNQIHAPSDSYEVEKVLKHYPPAKAKDKNDASKYLFDIKWLGYDKPEDNSLRQKWSGLKTNAVVHKYLQEHNLKQLIPKQFRDRQIKVKQTTDWYISNEHFRSIIDGINKHTKAIVYDDQPRDDPRVSKRNEELLPVGTQVRVLLDHPVAIASNERLHGHFRHGDIRWSREIKPITWVTLKPDQPPLYRVSGEKVLRTRQQLQVRDAAHDHDAGFA